MPEPEEAVATAAERPMLEVWLDTFRDTVVDKITGLSEVDIRRRLVPSLTTVGGVVKHLRWVETGWFEYLLGARSGDTRRAHPRDWEFTVQPDDTAASLVAEYRAACARSREVAKDFALDDVVPHHEFGSVSVRWIHVHLIEETARHAGHLDILREQIEVL
ncbi:DinB family protein [Actinophytocola algeriensis]|uniref:Putative damage-inducible protein DinB n=1 Tax=Actinophytocola algeriensis TaxID=1768010 RepID=A0A7W7VBS6_9PSEU|nr:DinB family protein [Actinophytocola algeriensis]MBB4904320.1 putative damage-inducible protein DinB [Actinophytocola algeriensis]MBE1476822.1 putative damage-inducible protein DinB [Actinophytocola algeriensis]